MNLAEFRTELDKLIKKFSLGGVSSEDLADELEDAAGELRQGEAGGEKEDGEQS
jgi:hypothetical protein